MLVPRPARQQANQPRSCIFIHPLILAHTFRIQLIRDYLSLEKIPNDAIELNKVACTKHPAFSGPIRLASDSVRQAGGPVTRPEQKPVIDTPYFPHPKYCAKFT